MMSAIRSGQLVPDIRIDRAFDVFPPVVTVTSPHTASGGTTTVRDVNVATVTVPAVVPMAVWNRTELPLGVGSNALPDSVTVLPGVTS